MVISEYENGTWIETEEACYPGKAMVRRGVAIFSDGHHRPFRAGLPDTLFTIPASARIKNKYVAGFLHISNDELHFHENKFKTPR